MITQTIRQLDGESAFIRIYPSKLRMSACLVRIKAACASANPLKIFPLIHALAELE